MDPVLPDPDPAISGAGSVLAGSRSGLRFKRHGHGSVQALVSGTAGKKIGVSGDGTFDS